ncbi:MAG TPA: hypothetical protein DEP84_09970 [Chloroflexi bacterium]|nr:hypothetical protein [Chloroflexota bacterium]
MTRLRFVALLTILGFLLGGAGSVAAQGGVEPQHTSAVWHGTYFNNPGLTPPAAFERDDIVLDFSWGGGSPEPGTINNDFFSVRWTRYLDVSPGTYRFTTKSDDGIRVYVDDQLIIDRWTQHPVQTDTADVYLGSGHHLVVVEYFEWQGDAIVSVTWSAVQTAPAGFLGEYYPNRDLSGAPITTRDDPQINFDWGTSSPFPAAFGTDNFSVRWTRVVKFDPGTYRFYATVDDGVRLWVNGHLLIDQWRDQPATTYSGDIYLSGPAEVKMEYFEHMGVAVAKLRWERSPGTPPGQATVYVVQRGDTLSSIARRFGTTVQAIMAANNLQSTTIYVGQRLIIPVGQTPPPPGQTTVYTVQRGDTLSAIARRFGTTVQAIMTLNNLRSTTIYVGQRLIVPVGTPPPVAREVIVDDSDEGFVRGGSATGWGSAEVGYGGHMFWTRNNQTQQANYNWARWFPQLAAGRYEVFVFIPSRNAGTHRATYWVSHADGFTSRVVDQSISSDAWILLGTYRFSGTNRDYVSLTDVTGEPYLSTRIGFDAVKWVSR